MGADVIAEATCDCVVPTPSPLWTWGLIGFLVVGTVVSAVLTARRLGQRRTDPGEAARFGQEPQLDERLDVVDSFAPLERTTVQAYEDAASPVGAGRARELS